MREERDFDDVEGGGVGGEALWRCRLKGHGVRRCSS